MGKQKAKKTPIAKSGRKSKIKQEGYQRARQTVQADLLYLLADYRQLLEAIETNKSDLDRVKRKLRAYKQDFSIKSRKRR